LSVRCLVDTNVLVYLVDPRNPAKSRAAAELLIALASAHSAVTTPQNAVEFYSVVTRGRRGTRPLLSSPEAVAWISDWLVQADLIELTGQTTREALRAAYSYQMHIYDAQMWAAAKVHAIPILLTEDVQSRREIEGVRYVNPFAPSFKPAQIGL